MVKNLPVPKWFSRLLSAFQSKATGVAKAVKQGLCDHWWEKETVWVHSAEPENRTVASRKARCVLCNHVESVEDWSRFPVNTRSVAECKALAAKLEGLP